MQFNKTINGCGTSPGNLVVSLYPYYTSGCYWLPRAGLHGRPVVLQSLQIWAENRDSHQTSDRHPRKCKFWRKRNCWRGSSCVYQHQEKDINSQKTMIPATSWKLKPNMMKTLLVEMTKLRQTIQETNARKIHMIMRTVPLPIVIWSSKLIPWLQKK